MASWGRAHAIKAALVAGFLLVLLNLFGSRYDTKIDKPSPISVQHTSFQQWPKRTHSSYEIIQSQQITINNNTANNRYNNNSIINNINNINNSNISNNKTPIILATTIISIADNSINNNNKNNNNLSTETQSSIGITNLNNINNMSTISLTNTTLLSSTTTSTTTTTTTIPFTLPTVSTTLNKLLVNQKENINTTNELLLININNNNNNNGSINNDSNNTNTNSSFILKKLMKNFGVNVCPIIPPNLDGPITVDTKSNKNLEELEKEMGSLLEPGGWYHPKECQARDRVAIIVPYRDRAVHIPIFLKNLHPFLMKQQIDYGIFIIEQAPGGLFNRAMLMNIGFVEALKLSNWDCFVFHDVDLLPMDDRNLYTCPDQPRHMSAAVDTFGFKLPYSSIFGGVSAMTVKQFKTVNGFSNSFWGWGGEDDDMSNRLKHVGYHIARYPVNIARYTMLTHKKEKANPKRYEKLSIGAKRYDIDGLNSLKYKVHKIEKKILYTLILTEINQDTGS